ncbi:cytosol aminopeptidase isoform X1 [Hydra vulgaris]|uniref:Cytosol aminopeptidase n=1 Tax=Hydra vulgaris TaxID=6087 RepID=T2MGD2_HYDVU|nr:cytosol aminopeptidase [Hydra vulgaris]
MSSFIRSACSYSVGFSKFSNKCLSTYRGAIIGCYKSNNESYKFTENGSNINHFTNSKLKELLHCTSFKPDLGKTRTFLGLHKDYECITITGLDEEDPKENPNEEVNQKKENIRVAVGAAALELKKLEVKSIDVDSCGDASASAEGINLSLYSFNKFKSEKKDQPTFKMFDADNNNKALFEDWHYGLKVSNSQNFARELMETPSNYKYPLLFANMVSERFLHTSVKVHVRDLKWAADKNMNCFLSVGQGSTNPPVFLEMHYKGSDQHPIVLVGKGITFDSGGISIKPSKDMALMRGDMGGAACVIATLDAVSKLKLPVNLVVLVPLAENMPSGNATKPGDVFKAMNGKTVEVDNTDAEGRLVLADALCYANEFHPTHIIDVATLTGAMAVALGSGATGTFSTSYHLWSQLHKAGMKTGDRMWRMPIYKCYTEQMKCSKTADLRNTQKSAGAGSCTAAAFLKEFVSIENWAHLDIAGVMTNEGEITYLPSGMSGRPTRTLIETVRLLGSS